jgi:hypothetical protein
MPYLDAKLLAAIRSPYAPFVVVAAAAVLWCVLAVVG